jgi:hypothetical protein
MDITTTQYKAIYDEILWVNEENIQSMFFVSTKEELKAQAGQFLINKWKSDERYDEGDEYYEEIKEIEFEIRWKGDGLYALWGLDFISGYTLAHITEIFEAETEVNTLIFLGNQAEIAKEKKELYEYSNYVYAVWRTSSELVNVIYEDQILDEISYDEKGIKNYVVTELNELDTYDFYEFLRQYAKLNM